MSTPTIHEAIEQYLAEYVTARNLAPLTRLNYASDLKHFSRNLTEQLQLSTIDQVKPRHLDGYLVTRDVKGMKGSSRRRHVETIRSLFSFLVQQRILPESPAVELLPRNGNGRNVGSSPKSNTNASWPQCSMRSGTGRS